MVSFSTIPSNLRIPLFWNEFAPPVAIGGQALKSLLIGQTVTAVASAPQRAVSVNQVRSLCGRGSMLALMMEAYRKADPTGEVWVLPLADDGGATAATGSVAFTGPATAAGTLSLYIAGVLVAVGVASGMSAASLATAVTAAITALPDLPVTAATSTATVNLTAKNGGTLGNDIDIRLNFKGAAGGEALPAGIGCTITAMASGATDPSLTAPLAALGSLPFEFIATPYNATLATMTALMSFTTGRWSWSQMLFGHVFSAKRGAGAGSSRATAVSNLATAGAALNDPHLNLFGVYDQPDYLPALVAGIAGVHAVAVNANNAPPPMQTVPVPGLNAPPPASQWSIADETTLLNTGIALLRFAADGTVGILRSITTYQTDAYGDADASYLDCETMFALAAFVRTIRRRMQSKFGRSKLAQDGTVFGAGSAVVTPKIARAEVLACYADMMQLGWVEDLANFKANLVVQINAGDPTRLDMQIPSAIVPGLHIIASQTQLNLGG